jgi:hypothetical protein
MALWPTTLRIGDENLKLLVTSPEGDDLLKARLPHRPPHPRALLTLLEGVALWSGEWKLRGPLAFLRQPDRRAPAPRPTSGHRRSRSAVFSDRQQSAEGIAAYLECSPAAVRRPEQGVGDLRLSMITDYLEMLGYQVALTQVR